MELEQCNFQSRFRYLKFLFALQSYWVISRYVVVSKTQIFIPIFLVRYEIYGISLYLYSYYNVVRSLVEDRSGDLTCVPPTGGPPSTEGLSSTTVVWIATGLVIGLFVIVAAAVIIRYMLKNSTIFKFKVGRLIPIYYIQLWSFRK